MAGGDVGPDLQATPGADGAAPGGEGRAEEGREGAAEVGAAPGAPQIMAEVERVASYTPVRWDNSLSRRVLGIDYRPLDGAVKEGTESIVDLGFAKFFCCSIET